MIGDNIAARLRVFAADVIRLCGSLPPHVASTHITRQLVRAATSGGANYEEARGAESRADFIHKIAVANKELLESRYWLGLVSEAQLSGESIVAPLIAEASELIAIMAASIRTARSRAEAESRR